jgi:hypothetical protein
VPLFVGEHGVRTTTRNGPAYVRAVYDLLDRTLASGAQWVYTPGWTPERKDGWNREDLSIADPSGTPRAHFAPRAYPRRIAGTPTSFSAIADASGATVIELQWQNDPAAGATELYLPAQAALAAPAATGAGLRCEMSDGLLRCTSPVAGTAQLRLVEP